MGFGRAANRRRADAARSPEELRARVRRAGSIALWAAAGLVLCAALATGGRSGWQWASTSKAFAAQQITFQGQSRAGEAELLRLSGLAVGQNLFALEGKALERSMAAHPWVKRVELTRHFPSQVTVTVVEHQPVAITLLGELYLVDDSGQPFKRVQAEDGVDLPLITGIDREEYVARPGETAVRFGRALALARTYGELAKESATRLSEVRLEPGRLVLVTGPGQEVVLPETAALDQLPRLLRVRAELERRGLIAEVIHLDNRARPGWVSVRVAPPRSERTGEPKQ